MENKTQRAVERRRARERALKDCPSLEWRKRGPGWDGPKPTLPMLDVLADGFGSDSAVHPWPDHR